MMHKFIPLLQLMDVDFPDGHAIGLCGAGQEVYGMNFRRDVMCLAESFSTHDNKCEHYVLSCENQYNFLVSFMAISFAGRHIVIPPNLKPRTIDEISALCGGCLLDDLRVSALLENVKTADSSSAMRLENKAADCFVTMYTSGSTGASVPVTKHLSALGAEIEMFHHHWSAQTHGGLFVSSVAHYHAYGLPFHLLWPLCAGDVILFEQITYPEALWDYAADYKLNFISSPAFLNQHAKALEEKETLEFLRFVSSAGSCLPLLTAQKMATVFPAPIVEIYGSTETGAIATRNVLDGAVWHCLSGVAMAQDAQGNALVNSAYTGQKEPFTISDTIEMHEKNSFLLKGRTDKIVKIHEKRVSLTQMEKICAQSSWIALAHLVVFENSNRLGCVAVLNDAGLNVLAREGKRALVEHLKEYLCQSFDLVVVPRKWRFVDALPVNDMGKVSQTALLDLFASHLTSEYTLKKLSVEGSVLSAVLFMPKELLYFDGHFDEIPILPGVVQVHWAINLACEHLGVNADFSSIDHLKFMRVIQPCDTVTLNIYYDEDKNVIEFTYKSGDVKHSVGKVRFA